MSCLSPAPCGDTNMYNDDPEDPAVELEEQSTMNSFFAMFSEGEEDSPAAAPVKAKRKKSLKRRKSSRRAAAEAPPEAGVTWDQAAPAVVPPPGDGAVEAAPVLARDSENSSALSRREGEKSTFGALRDSLTTIQAARTLTLGAMLTPSFNLPKPREPEANEAMLKELENAYDDDDPMSDMRATVFPRAQTHWVVMNPLLPWRLIWDITMGFLILFVMTVTPFELAFVSLPGGVGGNFGDSPDAWANKYTGLFLANSVVTLGFLVDMCFNFLTAVYDANNNRWLLRLDAIALHYMRTWFILDALTIIPLEMISPGGSGGANLIRLLRLFRLVKLARILKSQKLVSQLGKHIDMSSKLKTIILYCALLLVLVHWSACALRLLTTYDLGGCDYRSDGRRADGNCPETILTTTGNWDEGIWAVYTEACLWALITLTGEADTRTHAEGVLGMFLMLVGILILAFLIGDISNIMSNLDPVTNEFKQTLDNLNDYMRKKSNFPNALRLKLREYIMLSEPVYRDHFNKEMLLKLSPSLQRIVAKQNLGKVVNRVPFTAYTVEKIAGHRVGARVRALRRGAVTGEEPRDGTVVAKPGRLKYDVQYDDDGTVEPDVRQSRLVPNEKQRLQAQRLHFQHDMYVSETAHLFTAQLFMTFDVIVHQDLSLNDVMYVVESGRVVCLNYDKRKQCGIATKSENDYFGDDIAMLATGERKKTVRPYSVHAVRITQLHALDANDFIDLLEREPALEPFYQQFVVWGRWQRLKYAALRSMDGFVEALRKANEKRPEVTTVVDAKASAALLDVASDAIRYGLDGADAPATSPLTRADTRDALRALLATLDIDEPVKRGLFE